MTQIKEQVREIQTEDLSPSAAIAAIDLHFPTRGNQKLERLLENADADPQLKAWWLSAGVNATKRLGMSDHGWVHIQVVTNIALRILRLITRRGVEPSIVTDFQMGRRDAEVVVAAAAMLHDVGMSIHRVDHEAYSLFLAADKLPSLLEGIYEEPERSVVAAEIQHAIIGHRSSGRPLTLEAGIVRVADALDMAAGRSRVPFEAGQNNIHALSAAAVDGVTILPGEAKPVRVEIALNNSAGIFQIDELLGNKLRGSGLEELIEVAARVDRQHEARLLPDLTF